MRAVFTLAQPSRNAPLGMVHFTGMMTVGENGDGTGLRIVPSVAFFQTEALAFEGAAAALVCAAILNQHRVGHEEFVALPMVVGDDEEAPVA